MGIELTYGLMGTAVFLLVVVVLLLGYNAVLKRKLRESNHRHSLLLLDYSGLRYKLSRYIRTHHLPKAVVTDVGGILKDHGNDKP